MTSSGTRDGTGVIDSVLEPAVPPEVVSDDGPTEVVAETASVAPVESGDLPQQGEVAVVERVFPPGGISLKLVAKTASSRRPMDGRCLAEIAEMALTIGPLACGN